MDPIFPSQLRLEKCITYYISYSNWSLVFFLVHHVEYYSPAVFPHTTIVKYIVNDHEHCHVFADEHGIHVLFKLMVQNVRLLQLPEGGIQDSTS